MTRKGYFMISHLIIKWPTISSYPNLHQLNYEMPLFYANSGNIASLTSQPCCLSLLVWSINLRAVPELDSVANRRGWVDSRGIHGSGGGAAWGRCGQMWLCDPMAWPSWAALPGEQLELAQGARRGFLGKGSSIT